jgi:hypothetical protein
MAPKFIETAVSVDFYNRHRTQTQQMGQMQESG